MKELEVVTLDNKEYAIIKEIERNGISYLFLANTSDDEDYIIRKAIEDDIIPLDDEKEFDLACGLFFKESFIKKSAD